MRGGYFRGSGQPGATAKNNRLFVDAVLYRYRHLEDIPLAGGQWDITVRNGARLAKTLADNLNDALLFRRLATLDLDAPTVTSVDELRNLDSSWRERLRGRIMIVRRANGGVKRFFDMVTALAALIVLAIVVGVVAIDALGRLDERRPAEPSEADVTTTQKIVVDLSDRD